MRFSSSHTWFALSSTCCVKRTGTTFRFCRHFPSLGFTSAGTHLFKVFLNTAECFGFRSNALHSGSQDAASLCQRTDGGGAQQANRASRERCGSVEPFPSPPAIFIIPPNPTSTSIIRLLPFALRSVRTKQNNMTMHGSSVGILTKH